MVAAVAAAFTLLPTVISGGYPTLASGPSGVTLRYIPNQPFGIMVALRNHGQTPLVVRDVRVLEPPRTLVHQIGTRLQPWRAPVCTGAHSCPAYAPPFGPYVSRRPKPLRVAAGKAFAAELDFRLGGCDEVPFASPAAPRTIEIFYDGGREELALGGARPVLRFPEPADCATRPHSQISVSGPWATSSAWTIPGSAGDTCSRLPDGGVTFVSRWYESPRRPELRVEITPATRTVNVRVGVGLHGWKLFHAKYAVVTTQRSAPKDYGGRFHATIVGYRGSTFRAYGSWRCELRR